MNVINNEDLDDGTTTFTYATSPIMSSYLLAFAVGDYDYVEGNRAFPKVIPFFI